MSSCCVSGHLHEGTPEGIETEVAGLKCYVAAPSSGSKDQTILYVADIFGIDIPVLQFPPDFVIDLESSSPCR